MENGQIESSYSHFQDSLLDAFIIQTFLKNWELYQLELFILMYTKKVQEQLC